jgi:hypothetical protein
MKLFELILVNLDMYDQEFSLGHYSDEVIALNRAKKYVKDIDGQKMCLNMNGKLPVYNGIGLKDLPCFGKLGLFYISPKVQRAKAVFVKEVLIL